MATRNCVFSRHLLRQVDCPHCRTSYSFSRTVAVERQVEDADLEAAGTTASAQLSTLSREPGCETVRCPSCHRLGPQMLGAHFVRGALILGWIGLCLTAAWFIFQFADTAGVASWLLAIPVAVASLISVLVFFKWMLGGYVLTGRPTHR